VKVRFAGLESLANIAADFHSDDVEPDLRHNGSESETDETQTQNAHGSVAIADRNLRICHSKYARFEVIPFGGSWQCRRTHQPGPTASTAFALVTG
jgi:hypothetical protein